MNYIFFDFDGTVFDTAEGITKSTQYALSKLGIEAELSELYCFCGPPLTEMFSLKYGLSDEEALHAVELYRERYKPIGWKECRPYDGMHELMQKLKAQGKTLVIATSKPRFFAEEILKQFGMTDDFDLVCGSEFDGTRGKKHEVIKYALDTLGITPAEAIMVGDRKYDVLGAKECGLDCVGVGFGYAEENELSEAGAVFIAETSDELYDYLK